MIDHPKSDGRVGRTRQASDGVPVGTYVEVADVDGGWLLLLFEQDPRDVPGSMITDWWVDTRDDLEQWLGPTLDVEWLTESLPDELLVALLGDRLDGCSCRWVSADGIATWLHDAKLTLSEVDRRDALVVVPGLVDDLWEEASPRGRQRIRSARFDVLLVVDRVQELQVEDIAGIDTLVLADVVHDPDHEAGAGALVIGSAIPARIVVATPATTYRLVIDRRPALVHRRVGFLRRRWVVPDDPPPPWFATFP